MKGSSCDLMWSITTASAWRDWEKSWKTQRWQLIINLTFEPDIQCYILKYQHYSAKSAFTNFMSKNCSAILTNFLELSPSWEATRCAATQEITNILWNPTVHYHFLKSPPLVPVHSQINPIHTTPSYLSPILILSTHLGLGLPCGLFPSGFPINILYVSSPPHSCYK
jgi:hypothetical protein